MRFNYFSEVSFATLKGRIATYIAFFLCSHATEIDLLTHFSEFLKCYFFLFACLIHQHVDFFRFISYDLSESSFLRQQIIYLLLIILLAIRWRGGYVQVVKQIVLKLEIVKEFIRGGVFLKIKNLFF